MRLLFVSIKFFSVSLPLFQIIDINLKKGSSSKEPLLLFKLHKRTGGLKLAFGLKVVCDSISKVFENK